MELDETRAIKIKQEVHLHDKDFVIKQLSPIEHNKASGFASFFSGDLLTNLLTKFYSYLRDLGFVPGKEFAVAMEEAEKINANILLGDRSVAVSLSMHWNLTVKFLHCNFGCQNIPVRKLILIAILIFTS